MIEISLVTFDKVSRALSAAVTLALMHEPKLHQQMLDASNALDDAATGDAADAQRDAELNGPDRW